ncbi:peptidylprolyl isomerase [Mameliella alba]|uniref:peptidylprolyl isomerase n=1 Tax=Mameliella alba TaxID=561184 RepID=UPI000B52CFF4|nr:peptidylprolyl isomerase [Mameliella alba]OWV45814.1 peptidylprolyl isomerase [Mameliella alba]OWV64389.1 peptidylprolyl isomerase [Mameliella alba]
MFVLTRLLAPFLAVLTLATAPAQLAAQNLFAPAIQVNDSVITNYELQQRKRMLQVLSAPGDLDKLAREQLVDDRLRLQAARDSGIRPTDEEILDGMTEFAGRAGMTRDQFVAALGAEGVAEQTFRDFVHSGLSWRQLVQARFGARATVSEDEIDRALSQQGTGSTVRVLLSEIIMPVRPGEEDAVRARAERISQIKSFGAFAAEARQYSATATRQDGGRLPWRDLSELPPPLQPLLLGLAPGEVTAPIPLDGAIALFQMRDVQETGYTPAKVSAVEYAAYYMPGGRSAETLAKAREIEGRVDRCDDLYGIAKGQPPEVLERGTLPVADLPTDIALELSKLDPGEVSTTLTRSGGQTLVFLMLCGRSAEIQEDVDRTQITVGLRNQRLAKLADGYLSQLRADALIVER